MKAAIFVSLCMLALLAIFGCEDRKTKNREVTFNMPLQDVLSYEKTRRGVIFAQGGASGPYKEGGSIVGNVNTAGAIWAGEGVGHTKISWPATEGYFYEGTAYLNAANGAYIVVRKVPAP